MFGRPRTIDWIWRCLFAALLAFPSGAAAQDGDDESGTDGDEPTSAVDWHDWSDREEAWLNRRTTYDFRDLMRHLEEEAPLDEAKAAALTRELDDWPQFRRSAPRSWAKGLVEGEYEALLRFARTLSFKNRGLDGDDLADLLGEDALRRTVDTSPIIALTFDDNPLGDDGARTLASSKLLDGVAHLFLKDTRIGSEGVAALADSPHLADLKRLKLSQNAIGDAGAEALANSETLSGLETLVLKDTDIGEAGRRNLHNSPHLSCEAIQGLSLDCSEDAEADGNDGPEVAGEVETKSAIEAIKDGDLSRDDANIESALAEDSEKRTMDEAFSSSEDIKTSGGPSDSSTDSGSSPNPSESSGVSLTFESIETEGPNSPATSEIEDAVKRYETRLTNCIETKSAMADREKPPVVSLVFAITERGLTDEVTTAASDLDESVDKCHRNIIGHLRFSRHDGNSVQVRLKLKFRVESDSSDD